MRPRRRADRLAASITVGVCLNPPQTEWVLGVCWFCGADPAAVAWVGPCAVWGSGLPRTEAPLHACNACLSRIAAMALQYQAAHDQLPAMTRGRW